jgi:hypothetical protein
MTMKDQPLMTLSKRAVNAARLGYTHPRIEAWVGTFRRELKFQAELGRERLNSKTVSPCNLLVMGNLSLRPAIYEQWSVGYAQLSVASPPLSLNAAFKAYEQTRIECS